MPGERRRPISSSNSVLVSTVRDNERNRKRKMNEEERRKRETERLATRRMFLFVRASFYTRLVHKRRDSGKHTAVFLGLSRKSESWNLQVASSLSSPVTLSTGDDYEALKFLLEKLIRECLINAAIPIASMIRIDIRYHTQYYGVYKNVRNTV